MKDRTVLARPLGLDTSVAPGGTPTSHGAGTPAQAALDLGVRS